MDLTSSLTLAPEVSTYGQPGVVWGQPPNILTCVSTHMTRSRLLRLRTKMGLTHIQTRSDPRELSSGNEVRLVTLSFGIESKVRMTGLINHYLMGSPHFSPYPSRCLYVATYKYSHIILKSKVLMSNLTFESK